MLVITCSNFCNAQKIEIEKKFGGYKYTQNGEVMRMHDLADTMKANTEAFNLIKKAKSNTAIATAFSAIGGGLIGWPLGTAIGGGDANWTLAGIGAGLVGIAIPISSSANKKAKQAIDLYNASQNATAHHIFNPEFTVLANTNGVGLAVSF